MMYDHDAVDAAITVLEDFLMYTPSELADDLGVDEDDVEKALEMLISLRETH